MSLHRYEVSVEWSGDRGFGTASYQSYGREHEVRAAGKPTLLGSSDPSFRGESTRWNPEELLVASLSQCHLLSYLHLAAVNGVTVTEYSDTATGNMETQGGGGGRFVSVVLRPRVVVEHPSMVDLAKRLHDEAHRKCFIASSVNFPVEHEPAVRVTVSNGRRLEANP